MLRHRLNSLAYKLLTSIVGSGRIVTKDAPRRDMLAALYLRGSGLEIGALNNPLAVPRSVRVSYVDCATAEELRAEYEGKGLTFREPDIVDDGATLAAVPNSSQDFVIACHLIEHIEDPITAFKNWLRVLKPRGILFIAIPDKRFTFDVERDVTPFEHLLRDHEDGGAGSRLAHFEDSIRHIFGITDEEELRKLAVEHTNDGGAHTHYHVWTQVEMFELFAGLRRCGLDFEVEAFSAHDNEGVFVLRKYARQNSEMARRSLADARGKNNGAS